MQKNIEGQRVKELREKKGFSQTELANKVGVTYQIIGKIENGRIKSPSGKTAYSLAKALETTVNYLYGGEGFSESNNPEQLKNKIPVLDWHETHEWCKSETKNISEKGHEFINAPEDLKSEGVFALKITTDSMEGYGARQVPRGSFAIMSPTKEAKPNKFVLFFNKETNSSLLREAVLEDRLLLKPLNSQYKTRTKKPTLIPIAEVIGVYFNP